MILNLLLIVVIGLIAYIWMARGLWSAFLHMVCVILAGALAFAVWEPVSLFFAGTGTGMLVDTAWGLGLALPFVVFLLVLRVACDKLVPANVDFDGIVNTVGGLACGLVAGVLSGGILAMSVGSMRTDTELLGVQAIKYQPTGYLTREENLWTRCDTITAAFYEKLSSGALVPPSGESLGRRHPNLADENWLLRVNYGEGKSLYTIPPDSFEVVKHFVYSPSDPKDLFHDTFKDAAQQFAYTDNQTPSGPSEVYGYVVKFKTTAMETGGRLRVGPGQMRLVVQKSDDPYDTMGVQPFAVAAPGAGGTQEYGRWRYDTQSLFFENPAASTWAFEFVVPKGSKPVALYVKGIPVDVSGMQPAGKYSSPGERDAAAKTGFPGGASAGPRDYAKAETFKRDPNDFGGPIRVGDSLPYGLVIQKGTEKDLEISSDNHLVGGDVAKFRSDELKNQGLEPSLQIRRLGSSSDDDVAIVQVVVDAKNPKFGLVAKTGWNPKDPAKLIDSGGGEHLACGYVHKRSGGETWVYFNPQQQLTSLTDHEMPLMSSSAPDRELTLIFRVPKGRQITEFAVGNMVLAKFVPPVPTSNK
jgi:hypothetical protein